MSRINWFLVWLAFLVLVGMTMFFGGLVALENNHPPDPTEYASADEFQLD